MGFIGRLLGNPVDIAKAGETVAKGLDSLIYTKQEKTRDIIEAEARDVSEARNTIVKWMDSSKGQNLSRRVIALMIVSTWLFMFILISVFAILSIWYDQIMMLASEILKENIKELSTTVTVIIGFYFALPHLKNFIPNKNKK